MQTNSRSRTSPQSLTETYARTVPRRGLTRSAALIAISTLVASFAVAAKAPYHAATKPIKDDQGRVQVIIDFTDDAHLSFPGDLPPQARADVAPSKDAKFFHQPKVLSLVEHHEKKYGFERIGITSWVGASVTAYLTTSQIERIRDDELVAFVTETAVGTFSSSPPWYDFNPGGTTFSWGTMAVGSHPKAAGSGRKVYVIDGGVAQHSNLSLLSSKNVACGTTSPGFASTGDCQYTSTSSDNYPLVGCYAHATHVAGIVGGIGVAGATYGIYRGVDIVSVNVTAARGDYRYGSGSPLGAGWPGWCSTTAPSSPELAYALDYVYWDVAYNGSGRVGIANISFNSGQMGWYYNGAAGTWVSETNYLKAIKLATPGYFQTSAGSWSYYPGTFVAQSAGNDNANACPVNAGSRAFTPAVGYVPGGNPPAWHAEMADGIMVVGALKQSGQVATTFTPSYPGGFVDPGSNYGPCVDIWAPGNYIVSSWGNHSIWQRTGANMEPDTRVNGSYSGIVGYGNSGWMYLSGTSMASPHVAGAAAYLADAYSLTSPSAIETKIRQLSQNFGGTTDPSGQRVYVVQSQ